MSEFISSLELDVTACVTSGQVFRFKREGDSWTGVDGKNIIRAAEVPGGWQLESWPDANAYRELFQLDVSLGDVTARLLDAEPRLAPAIAAHPGLRPLHCASAEETLLTFLRTPNNHISRITRMVNTLASYGNEIADGLYEFPDAARVAEIPEEELRARGFGFRARTIVLSAMMLGEEAHLLDRLKLTTYLEANVRLCHFPGVGPKVADCVCLFGLWYGESTPIDVHVWRGGSALYFPEWSGQALTSQKYSRLSGTFRQKFGDLSGWAQQYLFYERLVSAGSKRRGQAVPA